MFVIASIAVEEWREAEGVGRGEGGEPAAFGPNTSEGEFSLSFIYWLQPANRQNVAGHSIVFIGGVEEGN